MTSTSLDLTWLLIVITVVFFWAIAIGIYFERGRRYGTRHTRRCLHAAVRDRDEARTQVYELSAALAEAGLPLPRPGVGPAGAAHAPAAPAAETTRRLRVVNTSCSR